LGRLRTPAALFWNNAEPAIVESFREHRAWYPLEGMSAGYV